jgi:hypothetical protein
MMFLHYMQGSQTIKKNREGRKPPKYGKAEKGLLYTLMSCFNLTNQYQFPQNKGNSHKVST